MSFRSHQVYKEITLSARILGHIIPRGTSFRTGAPFLCSSLFFHQQKRLDTWIYGSQVIITMDKLGVTRMVGMLSTWNSVLWIIWKPHGSRRATKFSGGVRLPAEAVLLLGSRDSTSAIGGNPSLCVDLVLQLTLAY
jgi:hypothetical protein